LAPVPKRFGECGCWCGLRTKVRVVMGGDAAVGPVKLGDAGCREKPADDGPIGCACAEGLHRRAPRRGVRSRVGRPQRRRFSRARRMLSAWSGCRWPWWSSRPTSPSVRFVFLGALLGAPLESSTEGVGEGWQSRSAVPPVGLHPRGRGLEDSFSLPYFAVDDLPRALAEVKALGGSVVHPGASCEIGKDSEGSPSGLQPLSSERREGVRSLSLPRPWPPAKTSSSPTR
jgi:hypothetical protein